jgi:hypothetical protein
MAATTTVQRRVALTTIMFDESLTEYLDETKPDPLAKKQVHGWTCNWTEDDNDDKNTPIVADTDDNGSSCPCSHAVKGTLALHGEHITIILRAHCHWTWENGTGSLEFKLDIRARFRTKSELKRNASSDDADTTTATKVDKKVRAGILKRLKQDDYVKKILTDDFTNLCQATVKSTSTELEERVWIDQDLLESIRRSVYSQADNLISVVELLTGLPFCRTPDCPLGHRTKLRLLEDAMLDACDREGEEGLIDELSLEASSAKASDDESEDDECEHNSKKKKT